MKKNLTFYLLIACSIMGYLNFNFIIQEKAAGKKTEKVSGAYEALQFWNMVRAYPNNDISSDAFFNAYEQMQEVRLNKPFRTESNNQWQAIGPHNTGGRTNALAFNPQNPNTIYVGSASGGLWRSYTAGIGVDAWHYVSTGFPVLGVSSITFAPNDSNTIYLGTGEVYNYNGAGHGAAYRNLRGTYGIGILKTIDGGQTWFKSLDWSYSSQKGVWAVKINPLNPNTVFSNTTEGVYRSYDAGVSWQQVNNIIMGMDIEINPIDTNIVLSSHGNFASAGYGIYRSSDGGNTWNQITTGLPSTFQGKILLDIYRANPNIVYASIGNGFTSANGASWLCKSTDRGITWTIMSTVDYSKWQGWFSHDVAVDQTNPNNLIIIGIEVYKSTDGGSTVIQKSTGGLVLGRPPVGGPEGGSDFTHSDAHVVVQHPTDPLTYYIGTDGGVFRTTDFGETYESRNGRYQTTQFYNGTSSSQLDSLKTIGGLQDNSTVIYDGDLAWIRVIGGDGSWTSIDPANDNNIYASWQSLNMQRSTNGGTNFSAITPPSSTRTSFIAPFRSFLNNHAIIYAGRDKIFKSTNSGSNWTATNNNTTLDGNPAIAMDISYQTSDKVYVATAPYNTARGNIFRTTNGGTDWTNITGILPDRFPSDIAVAPLDDNIVYTTFYGFGNGHIFKSTNSGDSWTDISDNLPDIPTPSVIVDPNNINHVYVGTDVGVFVSTNGGGNWQDFNDGLPDAVQAMDLNITIANNVIRVMTHGNGAYERKLMSQIITTTFQLSVDVNNGWNMVSIPGLHPADQNVNTWWPFRDLGASVFKYAGGYQAVATATPGVGYWMKHSEARTYNTGDEWPAGGIQIVPHNPLNSASGWNLIGGYELSVSTAGITTVPPGLQSGPVYKYSGGYQVTNTLDPGYGYWIKLTGAGQIIIPESLNEGSKEKYFAEDWGRIILTDAAGENYTLYAVNRKADLTQYELPPAPMAGMFDIRFSTGRIAEDLSSSQTIDMNGVAYPVKVRVKNMNITLQDETGKEINTQLQPGDEYTIRNNTINRLKVLSSGLIAPIEYALAQNYPNPFNPTTSIKYVIGNRQFVSLKLYDVLGNEIVTLVNEELSEGTHKVEFDGSQLPSGTYFYRLEAGNYTETRKMVLLK